MYYLIDTNRNNGCLRAIPGSHRKRHRLHDLPPQGAEEIRDVDESHPALLIDPDEVDVPVKAGDLVIGDHRLLHSAHPNRHNSDARLLSSGFAQPTINCLKRCRPFTVVPAANRDNWNHVDWALVKPLLGNYQGKAKPLPHNRIPDERLT